MDNRNYTNYSRQNKPTEKATEAQSDENVQNISETTEVTDPVTNTTPEAQNTQPDPEPAPPAVVTGVVVNCEKLNIRERPSLFAEVLCIINKGEKVEVIEAESTNDFYSVIYGKDKEVSVNGYCMKQYIKIN